MSEVTRFLCAIEQGDPHAAEPRLVDDSAGSNTLRCRPTSSPKTPVNRWALTAKLLPNLPLAITLQFKELGW